MRCSLAKLDLSLRGLRNANTCRQLQWPGVKAPVSDEFRGIELGGEVGEALNVLKKLVRERNGYGGSRATVQDLADELADVVICVDLLAERFGIDLGPAVIHKFNETSTKMGIPIMIAID